MILLGFAAGIAFNPVLRAAMGDVKPQEAGIASGVVNTTFMMGGALGLAILASISSSRAASLGGTPAALTSGYHYAFSGGATCALLAAAIGALLLHEMKDAPAQADAPEREPAFASE
jgi:MFS family permease